MYEVRVYGFRVIHRYCRLLQVHLLRLSLTKLFTCLPRDALLAVPGFFAYIQQGLVHPDALVRDLSAATTARVLSDAKLDDVDYVKRMHAPAVAQLLATEGFTAALVARLSDLKISVAEVCAHCFSSVLCVSVELSMNFHPRPPLLFRFAEVQQHPGCGSATHQ